MCCLAGSFLATTCCHKGEGNCFHGAAGCSLSGRPGTALMLTKAHFEREEMAVRIDLQTKINELQEAYVPPSLVDVI